MKPHPKDYCSAPDEQAKNPDALNSFVQIANGDEDALRFMWVFWSYTHCLDDLVDQDKPVTQDAVVRAMTAMITEMTFNPFWIRNSLTLHAFILQVFNRWVAGDMAEKRGDPLHVAIRCGDVDMYMHIAFLCGGFDHMLSLTRLRTYDVNQ